MDWAPKRSYHINNYAENLHSCISLSSEHIDKNSIVTSVSVHVLLIPVLPKKILCIYTWSYLFHFY